MLTWWQQRALKEEDFWLESTTLVMFVGDPNNVLKPLKS